MSNDDDETSDVRVAREIVNCIDIAQDEGLGGKHFQLRPFYESMDGGPAIDEDNASFIVEGRDGSVFEVEVSQIKKGRG